MELAAHICKSASIRRIRSGYRSSTSLGGTSSLSALQPRPHPGELLLVPLPPLPLSPLFLRPPPRLLNPPSLLFHTPPLPLRLPQLLLLLPHRSFGLEGHDGVGRSTFDRSAIGHGVDSSGGTAGLSIRLGGSHW